MSMSQFLLARMTLLTARACFLASTYWVALPALFVYHHFRAECLIRNILWIGVMTFRTCINLLFGLSGFVMTDPAIDPGRFEIVWMRGIQLLGIYLMVTLGTWDRAILYVRLMVEYHFTYRRRNLYYRGYLHVVRLGGGTGGGKKEH